MVIDIINVQYIAVGKAENNPPVGANRHGPKTFLPAIERMQSKPRHVHIRNRTGGIEAHQDVTQLFCVFGTTPRGSSSS